MERLAQSGQSWAEERLQTDRRLVVVERVAEDCLERMKLSSSGAKRDRELPFYIFNFSHSLSLSCAVIDAYFLVSPEVKRFRQVAELFDGLKIEVAQLKSEGREAASLLVHHFLCALTSITVHYCPLCAEQAAGECCLEE
jgi:hypothetical protein